MNINDVKDYWLKQFNSKYHDYFESDKEPRYQVKQFFLYSFQLLKRLGDKWKDYLSKYENLFLRDPSDDWYRYRNIESQGYGEARRNLLEWTTLFEIINLIGYPVNKSAKTKLLKNAKINLDLAMKDLSKEFHSLIVSSVVTNISASRARYSKGITDYIQKVMDSKEVTSIHTLIAYVNLLQKLGSHKELKNKIVEKIKDWIKKPTGNARANLLVVSRLAVRVEWDKLVTDPEPIVEDLKKLYNQYLSEIRKIDWTNSALFLEAAYYLNSGKIQAKIHEEISEKITPSKLVSLKEIFPYLDDNNLEDLDTEVEAIMEKCVSHPTKEKCDNCMTKKEGLCWMRVLAKELKVNPGFHGWNEVADTVVYTLQQGIYFVLKADKITKQRGEGDVLFRQCVKLFSKDFALVFYLNSKYTEPSVIEEIKTAERASIHSPKFIIIDKKYINQIYKNYIENYDS